MRLSTSLDLKRAAAGIGAVAVIGALACSDGLTKPATRASTDDDFAMAGVIVSSLMRADSGAQAPISTLSTQARLAGPSEQQNLLGSSTPISIDASAASALRTQAVVPASLSIAGRAASFDRRAGNERSIVRPHANGRSFKNRKDGKEVEVQFVDDPRGGNQPPAAMVTLVNGRAASVNQYTYRKIGKSWVPTSSRTTIYDSTGRATFVTSNNYSAMTVSAASLNSLSGQVVAGGFGRLVTALGQLVQPDVLYAATTTDEIDGGCAMKAAAAATAEFGWLSAVAVLAATWGTCAATIIECPAIIAAQAAVAIADYYFGKAQADYALCLLQQQPQPTPPAPPPGVGTGGGSEPPAQGSSCAPITWEISYDGGNSWDYLGMSSSC